MAYRRLLLPLTAQVQAAASARFAIGDSDFLLDGQRIREMRILGSE